MSGRTIWKGYIHFRNINVPVKLHPAVQPERIQFHLLHQHDHVKLHQQMICALEKTLVPTEEQVKGFELEERKYILVDPAELEQTEPEDGRVIEIHEFVKTKEIDPIFFERLYYLEPDVALKEYNALTEALKETGSAGICTWSIRRRSYHGALQVNGKCLGLSTLRYADEVVPVKTLDLPKSSLSEKELKITRDLIGQLSAAFQPDKFINEHQKKLENLIDKKARGEKIVILPQKRLKPTAPGKLLDALKASLKKVA